MAQFCHECGSSLESSDKFCRECGTGTGEEPTTTEEEVDLSVTNGELGPVPSGDESENLAEGSGDSSVEEASGRSRVPSRKTFLISAGALLGIAVVGLGVLWGSGTVRPPWDSEGATRDRLETPIKQAMRQRDDLLALQARYVNALVAVQGRVDRYDSDVASVEAEIDAIDQQFADEFDACFRFNVECPDPTYPDYPDAPRYGKELERMRDIASQLNQLGISLDLKGSPEPELMGFYAAVVKSAEALSEEANDNANLLNEAQSGDDEYRSVDTEMLNSLRADTALPALIVLNREALDMIELIGLDAKNFDVPGGPDKNRKDSSQAK